MSSKEKSAHFDTVNLHSDRSDKPEHGSLHKAVHTSIAFEYEDARDLAAVFQGKKAGYNYGRQQNPTVNALQNRITRMEGGHSTVAFATGMAQKDPTAAGEWAAKITDQTIRKQTVEALKNPAAITLPEPPRPSGRPGRPR